MPQQYAYPDYALDCTIEDILCVREFRETFLFGTVLGLCATKDDYVKAASSLLQTCDGSAVCPPSREAAEQMVRDSLFGNVPDSSVFNHLLGQLGRLSDRLGIRVQTQRVVMEPLDSSSGTYDLIAPRVQHVASNEGAFTQIQVTGPIVRVDRVRMVTPSGSVSKTIETDRVIVADARNGIINVPSNATWLAVAPREAPRGYTNLFNSALRLNNLDVTPNVWAVDYVKGPSFDGRAGRLPVSVKFHVWAQTARFLLSLHGNVTSKGVSSQSRSIDGITNSISLTASAMYGVNSAMEEILESYGDMSDVKFMVRRIRGIGCASV